MKVVEPPRVIGVSDELWLSQPGVARSLKASPDRAGIWWDGKWYVVGTTTSKEKSPKEPEEIGFLLTPSEFRQRKDGRQFTHQETLLQLRRAMREYPRRSILAKMKEE